MQENYAATIKPKWREHVKYDEQALALDATRTPELALAQNFLLYIGVDDERLTLKGWNSHKYLSELLVNFKNFAPPDDA